MLKFIYLKVDTGKFPQVKVPKIKLNCRRLKLLIMHVTELRPPVAASFLW